MCDLPRIMATFRPQQWVNDYAEQDGDLVQFDATEKFLRQPVQEIAAFRFNDYDSDEMANELPERVDHDGPFEVDMQTEVEDFFTAHGIDDWRAITQEQLDDLRRKYGIG